MSACALGFREAVEPLFTCQQVHRAVGFGTRNRLRPPSPASDSGLPALGRERYSGVACEETRPESGAERGHARTGPFPLARVLQAPLQGRVHARVCREDPRPIVLTEYRRHDA